MGVLNVTPDSFSDGGLFSDPRSAIARGLQMVEQGADLIDVGGESTRPGAAPVPAEEEEARVLPVVVALAKNGVSVSIDTSKPEVARSCLAAGAAVVNDVTALRDPEMREVCAAAKCTVCLMHMQGEPRTMQTDPHYGNVVEDVTLSLLESASRAGLPKERIWLDPGIGFGKTVEHNLCLLGNLEVLVATGYPVLVGVSRKSFIGRILGIEVEQRLEGTLAAQVIAQMKGARIVRAHDVLEARRAAAIAQAVMDQAQKPSMPRPT